MADFDDADIPPPGTVRIHATPWFGDESAVLRKYTFDDGGAGTNSTLRISVQLVEGVLGVFFILDPSPAPPDSKGYLFAEFAIVGEEAPTELMQVQSLSDGAFMLATRTEQAAAEFCRVLMAARPVSLVLRNQTDTVAEIIVTNDETASRQLRDFLKLGQ